jgi:hypothetical protein
MNQYSTPILKGFTIKSYVQTDAADSEASMRRAADLEAGQSDGSVTDPPYYPPSSGGGGSGTGGGSSGDGGTGGSGGSGGNSGGSGGSGGSGSGGSGGTGGSSGSGGSGGSGGNSSGSSLQVTITPKPPQVCHGSDLVVTGTVDGPYPIQKAVVLINGSEKDSKTYSTSGSSTSGFEVSFNFSLPTTDYAIGDSFVVEVKAFDTQGYQASDSFVVTVKDCSLNNPPVRNCLLFDSLHIEYYSPIVQDLMKFDIPASWLPYEVDNGNGAKVVFGWGDNNGIVAWYKDGDNTTGYGFQLSSIGINYLDEYNQPKTTWASTILDQSSGNHNTNLMLGDPAAKNNTWIDEIKNNANYTHSPSLGQKGDWISFGFDDTWNTKQCAINKQILDPKKDAVPADDPTSPPVDPYDPSKNPVRNCLKLDGIMFQYYSDVKNELQTVIVPLSWLVTQEIQIPTKAGNVTVLAGWSDYFKGVSLYIKDATGSNNLQITGIGVSFRDFYDNLKTAWSTNISFKTSGVKNVNWMIGGPKNLGDLPWVAEVASGNYSNAPCIGRKGDFVISKHYEIFSTQVCPVDPSHNSDPVTGLHADPVLKVIQPSDSLTSITQCNNASLTVSGYAEILPKVANIKITYRGNEVYNRDGTDFHEDFNVTLPPETFSGGSSGGTTYTGGKADIVFVIDYTGSMKGPISNVSSNLDKFITRLTNDAVDYRLGLVLFGDVVYGPPLVKFPYTNDQTAFRQRLDNIQAQGGGDTPESALEGIKDPANGALSFDFRSDAAKYIILLTDAPVHSKADGMSPYAISDIAFEIKDKGIKVTVISHTNPYSPEYQQLSTFTNVTGGQYLDINGDYGSGLSVVADSIADDSFKLLSGPLVITATDVNGTTISKTFDVNVVKC